ncbi:MAG: ATP-binding cassette subfamily B multidrug efflux pump [Limisphaerales bacterium]|jgi:ATP-binding cassette subfamily B multidrug efflux pump
MRELAYINKYFFKYRYRLGLGIFFVAASNIFGVVSPQVVRHAVDLVTENYNLYFALDNTAEQALMKKQFVNILLLFGGIYLGLAIIRGGFMFFMRQTIIIMSRLVEFDLKNELYDKYQSLDQAFYKRNNTGDLMSRVAEDVGRVRMYVGPALMYSINLVVLFTLVIYTMIRVNPMLTLYVLLPLPILSFSIYYVNNIINRKSEAIQKQLSQLTSVAQEVFSGIRVVKAYVQEKPLGRYFNKESEAYRDKSIDLVRVEALFHPLMLLLIGFSTILTIYIGGRQVIAGEITPGNVAEFVIYVNMLTWPVASLGWVASIIQRAAASQKRINEFLKAEPMILTEGSQEPDYSEDIEFKNVTFRYPDTGILAIKNLSVTIKGGSKVAILGRTGSGKTTLAELVVRMYDPDNGQICIGDTNLREVPLKSLRGNIAYVPQDVFLFSDSIAHNIQFVEKKRSRERAEELAAAASIGKEISQFPKGYDTIVGERGVTLSGGQKQRISIARALSRRSPIIMLDDCLSAVDAGTEKEILDNLNTWMKDKTALVITHRIFAMMDFDKIIVLDQGEIKEQGKHEELLALKGLYFDLYEIQRMEENYAD